MKLRNKKTGEVIDAEFRNSLNGGVWIVRKEGDKPVHVECYFSLAELNEEWEDYKPAEPLIKNAGMREVLRLWAKVHLIPSNATTIEYHLAETLFYGNIAPNAVHGEIYFIDEPCGEEAPATENGVLNLPHEQKFAWCTRPKMESRLSPINRKPRRNISRGARNKHERRTIKSSHAPIQRASAASE